MGNYCSCSGYAEIIKNPGQDGGVDFEATNLPEQLSCQFWEQDLIQDSCQIRNTAYGVGHKDLMIYVPNLSEYLWEKTATISEFNA